MKKRQERIKLKKRAILLLLIALICMPKDIFAKEVISSTDFRVISQSEKYYKTYGLTNTMEISEDEYNAANINVKNQRGNGTSETTYKKLTTSILSNGTRYRYKTVLTWKNFPVVRSYDVIGIGHYSNVKYSSNLYFSQTYCPVNGTCRTLTTYYPKTTSTGSAAAFKIPTGDLSSLSQTLYFDVEKNVNATINSQAAYGDYSHATENVTTNQAQNYSIGTSGIVFSGGVGNYYDNIAPAMATWNGTW